MDIAMEETKPIQNFTDMVPAVVVQPISASMISHFSKNGGNALGITPADGPLLRKYYHCRFLCYVLTYVF